MGGDPLSYQHLFWFTFHPEVYVFVIPAIGMIYEIIPKFSLKAYLQLYFRDNGIYPADDRLFCVMGPSYVCNRYELHRKNGIHDRHIGSCSGVSNAHFQLDSDNVGR